MQQLLPRHAAGGYYTYSQEGPYYGAGVNPSTVRPMFPAPGGESARWRVNAALAPLPTSRLGRLARGMGRLGTSQPIPTSRYIAQGAGAAAQAVGSFMNAESGDQYLVAAGGTMLSIAPMTGPAAPFVAIAGGIVSLLGSLGVGRGCGQPCVLTSQWANKAEELLTQNIAAYFALPTPRARVNQRAALENFDKIWDYLTTECGKPELGDAGRNCIADRQEGACKWRQTADSPLLAYPGEPQPGECWNWVSGYRDPIADDPNVIDAPAGSVAGATGGGYADAGGGSLFGGDLGAAVSGMDTTTLLLLGAVALFAFGSMNGGKG